MLSHPLTHNTLLPKPTRPGTATHSRVHIDARQEWVKMIRDKQLLRMIKVDTKVNVADLGTKILDKFTFQNLRGMLMHDLEYLCSAQQN